MPLRDAWLRKAVGHRSSESRRVKLRKEEPVYIRPPPSLLHGRPEWDQASFSDGAGIGFGLLLASGGST